MKKLINTKDYNCPTIEFGTGEVKIDSGFMDDVENDYGVLCFTAQEPKTIGEVEVYCNPSEVENSGLMFVFSKTESIDALIVALEYAKKQMLLGKDK